MSYSIVVLDAIASETIERMRTLLPPGFSLEGATENTESHRAELIRNADFAVSGQVAVTDEVLRSATRLKLLHKWGVGTDNFALDTAAELNIPVARTTGSNAVHITARLDQRTGRVIVVSAIDNLAKGASGGAVQAANVALGLPETAGLSRIGVAP